LPAEDKIVKTSTPWSNQRNKVKQFLD